MQYSILYLVYYTEIAHVIRVSASGIIQPAEQVNAVAILKTNMCYTEGGEEEASGAGWGACRRSFFFILYFRKNYFK